MRGFKDHVQLLLLANVDPNVHDEVSQCILYVNCSECFFYMLGLVTL